MRGELHYTLTTVDDALAATGAVTSCELTPRFNIVPGQHAPIEAVSGTPLLRDSFKKQRCLVLADGCYAWRELKQPIWFHPEPRRIVAFAGVWNENDDDGVPSFAILLGAPLVTRVKDAMPVVLAPDSYETWLDPLTSADEATELLVAGPLAGWRADTVSTRMASAQHDDARCIEPLGNPNQGELF